MTISTVSSLRPALTRQWVGHGDRTVDEMGHAWLNITYYNDEEFKAEQDKRAAMLAKDSQQQQ